MIFLGMAAHFVNGKIVLDWTLKRSIIGRLGDCTTLKRTFKGLSRINLGSA
jgi:hypothetical protein